MRAIGVTRPTDTPLSHLCHRYETSISNAVVKVSTKASLPLYRLQIPPVSRYKLLPHDLVRKLPKNTHWLKAMPPGLDPSPKATLALLVVSGILLFGFALPKSREKAEVYKRRFYMQSPFQKKAQAQEKLDLEGQE